MPTENKPADPKPTGLSQGWNLTRKHDGFVVGHQSAAYPPDEKAIERAERDGYVWVPFLVPSAQPQGEPVADLIRLDRSYRNGLMAGFHFGITGDEKGYAACIQRYNAGIKEAKAEQPAPVAVVLPDPVKVLHRFEDDPISQAQAQGWNACLDEVARLNAAQPVPVAAALPVDPERERLMEIVQQYPNVDPLKYDAAVRTLRK